ncbi:hypothetical protein KI688_004070 [Linnemannia hyalina]|uniref:Uncharacterized protein n=1 Tax=Linnemannia hyalina TaxID=64524 RepID=A0A9P8BQI1_9FUNG|nr:hypothetical protein KI688_004070 [Linnemannia hyalina]
MPQRHNNACKGWQKECDVLWLYGPLYNATQPRKHQHQVHSSPTCDWTTTFSQYSPHQQPASSPISVDSLSNDIESLAIAAPTEVSVSPLEELPTAPQTVAVATEAVEDETPESSTTVTAIETLPSLPSLSTSSPDSVAPDAVIAVDTAVSTTTTAINVSVPASDRQSGADVSVSPLHIDTSAPTAVKNESLSSSLTEENTLSRPKSALKQLGTMAQTIEELRSFTQTPHYLALTKALDSFSLTSSAEGSSSTLVELVEGTQSEPMSPITDGGNNDGSTFLLPIFPSPTKYHFRSHDRRRASFPKSASHPNQLNVNINLNMDVSVDDAPVAGGRRATIGGSHCSTSGRRHHNGRLVPSASAKQLRFSLEVQELIFLPTSPPFRITRARPTRAHSDPAIRAVTSSSFIAPQSSHIHGQHQDGLSTAQQHSLRRSGLFSKPAASEASFENTTTTFIKVRASSSSHGSRSRLYYRDDENRPECNSNDDDYYYEDCRGGCNSTTDEEFTDDGDDEDDYNDSEDLLDGEDDEHDEFNGLGRTRRHSTGSRHKRCQHARSRRYRLSSKDGIVARRANDTSYPVKADGPGVLWQVYTAVTGVKELIAWYGSMVYHSSSL